MLVTQANIFDVTRRLKAAASLALDTETTGLRPYHGDRLFSLILGDENEAYYFDFNTSGWQPSLEQVKEATDGLKTWYLANAKFDLAMLADFGVTLSGCIHDLQVHERLLDSTLFGQVFSLESIGERYGYKKDDKVKKWIADNRAFTEVFAEGKQRKIKHLHFDRVPFDLIVPYAEQDVRMTHAIGVRQCLRLDQMTLPDVPSLAPLVANERLLTKTVYRMERVGVKIDLDFTRAAAAYESGRRRGLIDRFESETGVPFIDSAKTFLPLFQGEDLWKTPKGAPSFAADAMETYKSPLARLVCEIRDAKHKADYYHGFLYHADAAGVVHSSFNQHQTVTGRFSSSEPNLQNLSKPEEGEAVDAFTVRRAIVPRPGYFLAMFDFDQMEYRLMLEYAGCRGLIDKVLSGLDVHKATAELAGVTRSEAKTTNFLTIYGGGDAALGAKLGVSVPDAQRIRRAIFDAAPEMEDFSSTCIRVAKTRGFLFNWFGRRQYFPDQNTAYRAPNHLIQGGCADVVKIAMNRVDAHLEGSRSRMVLSVHDEIVVECHEDEAHLLVGIQGLMEAVYPYRHLKLTCGASHSFKSLADKIVGYP